MEELDLKEMFEIFWSKKIQIILIILIFILVGVIYTVGFVNPVYTSSTTLVLASTNANATTNSITATDITVNSKLVSTYSEVIKSKNVLSKVIENLNISVDEDSIRNQISVTSVKDTEVIKIAVTNENPTYSAQIANEIAKVFTEKVKEIYNMNNVQVLDEAKVSSAPSNINHQKDVLIFAFIGMVISIIYTLVANMLDTTVKTPEDIEKYFKVPVLASIPMYGVEQKKKGGKR